MIAHFNWRHHMPGAKKILTTVVIVLLTMAVVSRVPQLRALVG